MNKKHVGLLVVVGLIGAANGVAAAEPAVAPVVHIINAALMPLAAWLGMTSPKAGAAQ